MAGGVEVVVADGVKVPLLLTEQKAEPGASAGDSYFQLLRYLQMYWDEPGPRASSHLRTHQPDTSATSGHISRDPPKARLCCLMSRLCPTPSATRHASPA